MRYCFLALLFVSFTDLFSGGPDSVQTGNRNFSVDAEAGFYNRYIYRGIIMQNNAVFQPGIKVTYDNFSAGIWCNVNMPQSSAHVELTETDLSVSHEFSLYRLIIRNSAAVYIYSGNQYYPATAEYSFGVAYNTGITQFYTDLTVDFAHYAGSFLAVHGFSCEMEFYHGLFLNTSLSIGWAGSKFNRVNTGLSKTAFGSLGLDVSVSYYPAENIYISPLYQYNRAIDKNIQKCIGKQNSFFGISTGYAF